MEDSQTRARTQTNGRFRWEVAAIGLVLVGFLALTLFSILQKAPINEHPFALPTCRTNLVHNAVGIRLYAADNDDQLPRANAWMDAILPYTKNEGLYRCPEVKKGYGYAINRLLDGRRLKDIENPDAIPLVFDSTDLGKNAASTLLSLPAPPRHGKMNFVGLLDGSAKAIYPIEPPDPAERPLNTPRSSAATSTARFDPHK